ELSPGDAALVRQIAESYRAPERTAAARAAFRAGVDARIRRRASDPWWMAGAAAVAVALAAVWLRGPAPLRRAPERDVRAGEALLALALPADSAEDEAMPADYEAIEDLLMEGV